MDSPEHPQTWKQQGRSNGGGIPGWRCSNLEAAVSLCPSKAGGLAKRGIHVLSPMLRDRMFPSHPFLNWASSGWLQVRETQRGTWLKIQGYLTRSPGPQEELELGTRGHRGALPHRLSLLVLLPPWHQLPLPPVSTMSAGSFHLNFLRLKHQPRLAFFFNTNFKFLRKEHGLAHLGPGNSLVVHGQGTEVR